MEAQRQKKKEFFVLLGASIVLDSGEYKVALVLFNYLECLYYESIGFIPVP